MRERNRPLRRMTALLLCLALLLSGCAGGQSAEEDRSGIAPTEPEALGEVSQETEEETSSGLIQALPDRAGFGQSASYTLMVYLVGSDLETNGAAASMDLQEMEAAGLDPAEVNLVVYAGGSSQWYNGLPSNCNTVLKLGQTGFDVVGSTSAPANMGDADTLVDFLDFTVSQYPADHYGLILWDHGGGPIFGYGNDELTGDYLDLPELVSAMERSSFSMQKLDWVGFDACLMGTLEIAHAFAPYADYLVASQETEAASGWDYSFLSVMNDTDEALEIISAVLVSFAASFDESMSSRYAPDYTLSCVDLSRLGVLDAQLDAFFGTLQEDLDAGNYARLARQRDGVKRFGLASVADRGDSPDLVDLGSVAQAASFDHPEEAQALLNALSQVVLGQVSNVWDTSGLSIYYPYDNLELFVAVEAYYPLIAESIAVNDTMEAYLDSFTGQWLSGESGTDWSLSRAMTPSEQEVPDEGEEMLLPLTEEQLEHYSSAYLTILEERADGVYTPVLTEYKVEPDENGVIHIDLDPEVFIARSGEQELGLLVRETESGEERSTYATEMTKLFMDPYYFGSLAISEDVSIGMTVDQAEELTVTDVVSEEGTAGFSGKASVDVGNWNYLCVNYRRYLPARDAEGNLLPYTDWEDDGWYMTSYIAVDDTLAFERRPVSELENQYICQVIVTDTNGGRYASELVTLTEPQVGTATQETEGGVLEYALYEDHAVLTSYDGSDAVLELPAEVEGLPLTAIGSDVFYYVKSLTKVVLPEGVTEIGQRAFSFCSALTEVSLPSTLERIGGSAFSFTPLLFALTLPEGLEEIGDHAFDSGGLREVTIPSTVTRIGAGAFAGCDSLAAIEVAEGSETYAVREGYLLADGGKTLVAAPGALTSAVLPEGVEVIAQSAMAGQELMTEVTLPASLREIGDFAFYNSALSSLSIPEGTEQIGNAAFANGWYCGEISSLRQIEIPASVTWIGECAFAGQPVTAFRVDGENGQYASVEGFLTDKNGQTLLACPGGLSGTVTVPEGILTTHENAFAGCNQIGEEEETLITSLVLPESLVACYGLRRLSPGLEEIHFGKNVQTIDPMTGDMEDVTFFLDEENPFFTLQDGALVSTETEEVLNWGNYLGHPEVTVETERGALTFRLESDHAVLLDYEGTDEAIVVPDTVEGLPVTETYFFPDSGPLPAEVTLPEGLLLLSYSFSNSDTLTTLHLPASLTAIESCFAGSSALETVTVAEGSEHFQIRDGILYTADGKTLVSAFAGQPSVTIPEGVEVIGEGAFRRCEVLTGVTFPSTLREIGEYAFSDCSLASIDLPEGVTTVGNSAFGNGSAERCQVNLPASLTDIGDSAFWGVQTERYQVAADNPRYTSLDGWLASKDGAILYASPAVLPTEVEIPEGVQVIEQFALSGCTNRDAWDEERITSVRLPESLLVLLDNDLIDWTDRVQLGSDLRYVDGWEYITFEGQTVILPEDNPWYRLEGDRLVRK